MKKRLKNLAIIAVILTIVFQACTKMETRPSPTMSFSDDTLLVNTDTIIAAGDTVQVGINCKWNGQDELKTLSIYLNNQYVNTFAVPNNVMTEGVIDLKLIKTGMDSDGWLFELVDANGQRGYLGIMIRKDKTGGTILKIANIVLGAQSNTGIGNFFSLQNGTAYTLQNASNNQATIDLVHGYNDTDKAYLASPAADLTNDYDLSAWTVKNNTLFYPTTRTPIEFDLIETDKPIISSFKEDGATTKATSLAAGKVYSFKSAPGKYGLIKVITVPNAKTGTISFEVKMQN